MSAKLACSFDDATEIMDTAYEAMVDTLKSKLGGRFNENLFRSKTDEVTYEGLEAIDFDHD